MSEFSPLVAAMPPVALICLVGGLYAVGRSRLSVGGRSARGLWFYLGLVLLISAMAPPLEEFSGRSLSAHMTQHVIVLVIAPLFLVLADPWNVLLAGLPDRVRTFGAPKRPTPNPTRSAGGSARMTWTRTAILVTVLQSLVMWVWHIPALYDLAVQVQGVHAIEHLSFLGVGLWFWWAVGATGSRHNGVAALVVFIAALPGTALGAALILAKHPWYPAYPDMQDQQVAGAIMWSVAGAVYLAGAVVLFISWLNGIESSEDGEWSTIATQNA